MRAAGEFKMMIIKGRLGKTTEAEKIVRTFEVDRGG